MHRRGRKIGAVMGDALVGHEVNIMATPAQFLRQCHGGKQVPPGPPGHQCKCAHLYPFFNALRIGRPVANVSSGLRRVSASNSPMPSPMAIIEVPP